METYEKFIQFGFVLEEEIHAFPMPRTDTIVYAKIYGHVRGINKPRGLLTSPPSTDRGISGRKMGLDTRSLTGATQYFAIWGRN